MPVITNRMLAKETLSYRQRHSVPVHEEQVPASFVGQTPTPLEATGDSFTLEGEKIFYTTGWQMSTKLVNEEALEVNSVV